MLSELSALAELVEFHCSAPAPGLNSGHKLVDHYMMSAAVTDATALAPAACTVTTFAARGDHIRHNGTVPSLTSRPVVVRTE